MSFYNHWTDSDILLLLIALSIQYLLNFPYFNILLKMPSTLRIHVISSYLLRFSLLSMPFSVWSCLLKYFVKHPCMGCIWPFSHDYLGCEIHEGRPEMWSFFFFNHITLSWHDLSGINCHDDIIADIYLGLLALAIKPMFHFFRFILIIPSLNYLERYYFV